jgi:hypothetical protein
MRIVHGDELVLTDILKGPGEDPAGRGTISVVYIYKLRTDDYARMDIPE